MTTAVETAPVNPAADRTAETAETAEIEYDDADLLVEDVSIDGMCGVY